MFKHTVLYQRVRNNETLLEPKVNVNGHQIGQMLLGDGVNLLSKWLLKPCIFSPTVAAREKNLSKNLSSTRITVEHVFGTLKVRSSGLLTMLVANRENISNKIITCFVLPTYLGCCLD